MQRIWHHFYLELLFHNVNVTADGQTHERQGTTSTGSRAFHVTTSKLLTPPQVWKPHLVSLLLTSNFHALQQWLGVQGWEAKQQEVHWPWQTPSQFAKPHLGSLPLISHIHVHVRNGLRHRMCILFPQACLPLFRNVPQSSKHSLGVGKGLGQVLAMGWPWEGGQHSSWLLQVAGGQQVSTLILRFTTPPIRAGAAYP